MRTGPRLLAALAVALAGAGTAAMPVLASTSASQTPIGGEVVTIAAPELGQQTATTRKPTVTTRRTTVTTRKPTVTTKKQTVTTKKPALTTVATTVATTPPPVPTLATTVPLPTQPTALAPVSAPPTTVASINDLEATKLVNRVIAALVGLSVLVALLTFVYWRSTKPVPPALDGLDLMSTRKWLRGKPDKRTRLLADFRTKRGPVPEEVIVRTAPTVRVGAAVAAPVVVPAMASSGSSLVGLASDDLTDEPPVVVMPDTNGSASGSDADRGPDTGGTPADPDASFTVVARRPRGERSDGDG